MAEIVALPKRHLRQHGGHRKRRHSSGAGLVEFVLVAPTLLAMTMAALQYAMVFHAKFNLNYAALEGARAGALAHASPVSIHNALARALTAYYGGGKDLATLTASAARARTDLAGALRIEILSPTAASFDDYHSEAAARRAGTAQRTIPSSGLSYRPCPQDRPGCNHYPAHNASGQTLADANLLKLRITWGLPPEKQMPLAGRFFVWAVRTLNPADGDSFRQQLLAAGRIPVVAHSTVRMHSDPIENSLMVSPAGSVADESPLPPATGTPIDDPPLPGCPAWEPLCTPPPGSNSAAPGTSPPSAPGEGEVPDGSPLC